LFAAVLGYSRARRPARVLLATLAALADDEREVVGLTTAEIRAAAGLSDRTYRRARAQLLASGSGVAENCAGGRGNTSRWRLADPQLLGDHAGPRHPCEIPVHPEEILLEPQPTIDDYPEAIITKVTADNQDPDIA
jgi:hypothetical protein